MAKVQKQSRKTALKKPEIAAAKKTKKVTAQTSKAVSAQTLLQQMAENPFKSSTPKTNLKPFINQEDFMSKNTQFFEQMTQNVSNANKESMEAMVQSGTRFFKGMEDFSKTLISMSQDANQKNTEAFKTLMGCKTITELSEAQTKLAQQSFDDMVSNTSKLSEIGIKLATECTQPINDQMAKQMKQAADSARAA